MTLEINHAKVSQVPDSPDPTLIQPSDWNEPHFFNMDSGYLLGRMSEGPGAVEELPINELVGVTSVNGRAGAVELTSEDVGLENCDNTSDMDKPISTAQAEAFAETQPLNEDLTALSNLSGSGYVKRNGPGNFNLVPDPDNGSKFTLTAGNPIAADAPLGVGIDGLVYQYGKWALDGTLNLNLPVSVTVKYATSVFNIGANAIFVFLSCSDNNLYLVWIDLNNNNAQSAPKLIEGLYATNPKISCDYDNSKSAVIVAYANTTGAMRVCGMSLSTSPRTLTVNPPTTIWTNTQAPPATSDIQMASDDNGLVCVNFVRGNVPSPMTNSCWAAIANGGAVSSQQLSGGGFPIADPASPMVAISPANFVAGNGRNLLTIPITPGATQSIVQNQVSNWAKYVIKDIQYDYKAGKVVCLTQDTNGALYLESGDPTAAKGDQNPFPIGAGSAYTVPVSLVCEDVNEGIFATVADAAGNITVAGFKLTGAAFDTFVPQSMYRQNTVAYKGAQALATAYIYYQSRTYAADFVLIALGAMGTPVNILDGLFNLAAFVGMSESAYNTGDTATIYTVSSIWNNPSANYQIGGVYYVQPDGTLSLSSQNNPPRVGTAVSPTTIVVGL